VGTALSAASPIWFTISHGIFNEIYYPRLDQACTRDMGLLITTPGSATIGMLETKPADTPAEIEAAINSIMVGMLDLANGVAVNTTDGK